ncbi:MAG: flagellar hook-associated protein FlgK [Cypionkella sp.]|nr:flagellar hook-associated protein FlgK [Cypionkella sp.]
MSISGAMHAALSGLSTTARGAEVVSTNIANAQTEGYGRREMQVAVREMGATSQGVRVAGIVRHSDPVAISDRRLAGAGAGARSVASDFLQRIETAIGTPDSETSVNARIAAFERALIEATSRPDSEARLNSVAQAAKNLIGHIGAAATEVQTQRARADDMIEDEVGRLNKALAQVADLNTKVLAHVGTGRDASGLMDQRQQIIDSIAQIIPLREVARDGGKIALFTTGGAVLVEGSAATIGFIPVGVITPDMTLASGALSGLTLNGQNIPTDAEGGLMSGGTLAAYFALRDVTAPQMQEKLDAIARDLLERFASPAVDTTLAPGDAGLFTDMGGPFAAANELGLAQRLRLNPAADPAQGGALWRLRDGLGAAAQGAIGNASLLGALGETLTAQRSPVSGGFSLGTRSYDTLVADMVSGIASARLTAQGETSFANARFDHLKSIELADGVDTDQEMQTLLLIEQSYAANARVMKAASEMIQTLLGF